VNGTGNLPLSVTGIDMYSPHVNLTIHYIDRYGTHTTLTENGSIANNTAMIYNNTNDSAGATQILGLNLTNGTNYIWVVVKDNGTSNWVAGTNYTIHVDTFAPTGVDFSNYTNETRTNGTSYGIWVNATDSYSSVMNCTIYVNDTPVNTSGTDTQYLFNVSIAGTSGGRNITLANLSNGPHSLVIEVTDNASFKTNSTEYVLHVDTSAPYVTSTSVANGSTGSPVSSTSVAVVFNESLTHSTITNGTFKFTRGDGANISATVSQSNGNTTYTLVPTTTLDHNTQYTINITTGVKDASGRPFANDYWFTFVTGGGTPTSSSGSGVGSGGPSISVEAIATAISKSEPVGEVELRAGEKAGFSDYGGTSHTLKVISIVGTQVTVRIESSPIDVLLKQVGVPVYVNIDDHHANDIKVTLVSLINRVANVKIELLNKGYTVAPATTTSAATATSPDGAVVAADTGGEDVPVTTPAATTPSPVSTTMIVGILAVVAVLGLVYYFFVQKK